MSPPPKRLPLIRSQHHSPLDLQDELPLTSLTAHPNPFRIRRIIRNLYLQVLELNNELHLVNQVMTSLPPAKGLRHCLAFLPLPKLNKRSEPAS